MRSVKQSWKTVALVVGLSLALVTVSVAQGPGDDDQQKARRGGQRMMNNMAKPAPGLDMGMFRGADVDNDGTVNQDEFKAYLAERQTEMEAAFLKADANGDGSVDRTEMQAVAEQQRMEQAQRMFQMMDKDGDGKIAQDEFRGRDGAFEEADGNSDGFVDAKEWDAQLKAQIQERMQKARGNRQGGGEKAARKSPFDQLDLNGDGKIDETEAGEKKNFLQRFDTDADGEVSREEFQAGMQERLKDRKQDANTDRQQKKERKGKDK